MKIVAVVPTFRASETIVNVVSELLKYVDDVIVVDDHCPESSGEILKKQVKSERLTIVRNRENLGVGGATKIGFQKALEVDYEVIVKVDADGQMLPEYIPVLATKLSDDSLADFAKGNRFFSPKSLSSMPPLRILGNGFLSLVNKSSSGYYSLNDPTNGFIAIKRSMLIKLELEKLHDRYFFESDLLFRLYLHRAVVAEVPMDARYRGETSNLSIIKTMITFPWLHARNTLKRIVYSYYIRSWSFGSVALPVGILSMVFGAQSGLSSWQESIRTGIEATAGTVMLAALPVILGFQLFLTFVSEDIGADPNKVRKSL